MENFFVGLFIAAFVTLIVFAIRHERKFTNSPAKNLLLHIWQLPQHIVAWVIIAFFKGEVRLSDYKGRRVYVKDFLKGRGEAVCLGDYIFIDPYHVTDGSYALHEATVAHEYGHSRQSRYFGWLYLLVIGLPSVCNVFSGAKYYTVYPENWANMLGGVEVEITGTRSCDWRLKLK